MIKAEFREDVLDASATLDRLTSASLVRVDDLDAVAGPAERDGHVGQRAFAHGRLLVLSHLLGTRLADIDDRFSIEGSDPKESVPWSGVSLLPHAR